MVIIIVFHMFKKLSKNMENIKKNLSKLLVVKTTMCERRNTLFKVNSKLDIMEEKISELEGIAIEANETKKTLKLTQYQRGVDNIKQSNIWVIGITMGIQEKVFEEIIDKIFQIW